VQRGLQLKHLDPAGDGRQRSPRALLHQYLALLDAPSPIER
jgi:hypothetical protein